MSFTKKQIAKAANYIAEKLISSDESSNRKWFCQQFKQVLAEHSQADSLEFSNVSQDFSQLRDAMQEKGIQVPAGFKVRLFNNGKTTARAGESAKEKFDLQDLGLALQHCDEQFDSSEEEDWEAEFRAPAHPMLSQFIIERDESAAASSVGVDKDLTLSPRQKVAAI